MRVDYLDHMGSDLTVVDRARVSFAKRSKLGPDGKLLDKDTRLINYLASHKHMLPFRHPHISFHFKAPVFVARQLVKHQVGMSWSEISRRYVTSEPEFYLPDMLRAAAADKKQGSQDVEAPYADTNMSDLRVLHRLAFETYREFINRGVAPEQARMVLPVSHYTEWHWTGSLLAWAHVWNERTAAGAQKETRECVQLIGPKMRELFPVSWGVLTSD